MSSGMRLCSGSPLAIRCAFQSHAQTTIYGLRKAARLAMTDEAFPRLKAAPIPTHLITTCQPMAFIAQNFAEVAQSMTLSISALNHPPGSIPAEPLVGHSQPLNHWPALTGTAASKLPRRSQRAVGLKTAWREQTAEYCSKRPLATACHFQTKHSAQGLLNSKGKPPTIGVGLRTRCLAGNG